MRCRMRAGLSVHINGLSMRVVNTNIAIGVLRRRIHDSYHIGIPLSARTLEDRTLSVVGNSRNPPFGHPSAGRQLFRSGTKVCHDSVRVDRKPSAAAVMHQYRSVACHYIVRVDVLDSEVVDALGGVPGAGGGDVGPVAFRGLDLVTGMERAGVDPGVPVRCPEGVVGGGDDAAGLASL